MENYKENYKILSNRLKELRHKLGMTQNQFCEKIGFTQATLSAYETMSKSPSLDILLEIAKKCEVSLDWLLGLSNNMNSELNTIPDVILTLITLSKNFDLHIASSRVTVETTNSVTGYPDFYEKETEVIYFEDNLLQSFLLDWKKMKSLYDSKEYEPIDDDVYNLWIEKCIKKYRKEAILRDEFKDIPF